MNETRNETRYHRQLDILDPKLMDVAVTVIGVGATGSFTAQSGETVTVTNGIITSIV